MMRRGMVAALVLSLAGAVLASGLATSAASATTPEDDAANALGFAQLGSCLSSAKRVEALYVMDVSASLKDSDPKGERFGALETSVAQLGALVGESDGKLKVEAALATFGYDFAGPGSVKDWTAITGGDATQTAADFRTSAEAAWKAAKGQGTDYSAALAGARDSLLARGAADGTCRVMFWFTDGLFDLDTPKTTNAASDKMCAPGGLVDKVRADSISVIALALFNKTVAVKLDDAKNAQRVGELQAIAWGQDGSKTCGTVPLPEGSTSGVYLSVDDSAQLAAQFSGAIAQGRGGVPIAAQGIDPVTVEIVPGVRQFEVDVTSTSPTASVTVTPPGGTPTDVPADGASHDVSGGRVVVRPYGALTVVQVSMPGSGTQGPWQVQVPTATAANAYVYSGLSLTIQKPSAGGLQAGAPGSVTVLATDLDGQPADLSMYSDLAAKAVVSEPGASAAPASTPMIVTDAAAGRLDVSVSPAGNVVALRLLAQITPTLSDGTVLATKTDRDTVEVTLPTSYPKISPATELDLGQMDGVQPASGTLTLTGSTDGTSRVCIPAATEIVVPERAEAASIVLSPPPTDGDCYPLPAGESQTVTVTASTRASADGGGSALLAAYLEAVEDKDGNSAVAKTPISVSWQMARPVDNGRRIGLLLLFMIIAIALPIAVLLILNRFLARFRKGNLQFARREIRITDAGLETVDGQALLIRDRLDYDYIAGDKTRRITAPGAGMFAMVSKASWNPFGGPHFYAVAADGWQVVGAGSSRYAHDGERTDVTAGLGAAVILAVQDVEILRADEGDPVPATAVLVTRAAKEHSLDDLALRVQERFDWPTLRNQLRATAQRRAAANQTSVKQGTAVPAPVVTVSDDDDPLGGPWHGKPAGGASAGQAAGTYGQSGATGPTTTSKFNQDDPLA